jgi:hypothetical protein
VTEPGSLFADRFWWPLELSERATEAVESFQRRMLQRPVEVDRSLAAGASDRLADRMASHVAGIVERDGLPHLCHVINGWGDGSYAGRRLSDFMAAFIHRDPDGRAFVLQRDPEGEFHPWQSFAYAAMAGVDAERPLGGSGATLRELARNSRYVNTGEGRELGHLLFGLSYLDPELRGGEFLLQGERCDAPALLEKAVEAHHFGSFAVCRKFHLTEGLCAAARRLPGVAAFAEPAQGFLEGQLDMMLVLGAILSEVRDLARAGREPGSDDLLTELRRSLVIGPYFENHTYYAGHAIELAAFAHLLGYRIRPDQWRAMAFVFNELNAVLPEILPQLSFLDCFLHLGHYRRALTLLVEIGDAEAAGREVDLRGYRIDFDGRPASEAEAPEGLPELLERRIYQVEEPSGGARAEFESIVESYGSIAESALDLRGQFDHFRRVLPSGWPRSVHYELLDYGGSVGAEIHLETEAVRPLAVLLQGLAEPVARIFPGRRVEWDPAWWRNRGRLRVMFPAEASPEEVAHGFQDLIRATFPALDPEARGLGVRPELQPTIVVEE